MNTLSYFLRSYNEQWKGDATAQGAFRTGLCTLKASAVPVLIGGRGIFRGAGDNLVPA